MNSRSPYAVALLAFALAVSACFAVWWWLGQPQTLRAAGTAKVSCVSYTPYRGNQSPLNPKTIIPPAQIDSDLEYLSQFTDCIRTYGVEQGLAEVPRLARAHGMKVLLGLWLGSDLDKNDAQVTAAVTLANTYADVVKAVVVGNEVLLRRELPPARLAAYIHDVKARVRVPVTYADVWEFWLKNPMLAAETDFITIHVLPYWEDIPIAVDRAVDHVKGILGQVHQVFPNKSLLIGETGWPSAGRMRGPAEPGRLNQARYIREFIAMATISGVDYNLIESFDQPWKTVLEGTVGGYWGVYSDDRQPKFPLTGDVSEHPDWQRQFVMAAVIGVLPLLWLMVVTGPRLRFLTWLGVAVAAQVVGSLLVLQAEAVATVSLVWYEWLVGFVGLAVAAVVAWLVMITIGKFPEPTPVYEAVRLLRQGGGQDRVALILGLCRGVVLFSAAAITLGLLLDPRYRNFPTLTIIIPAIGFLFTGRFRGEEETILALLIALGVLLIPFLEGIENVQALMWSITAFSLVLPYFSALITRSHFYEPKAHP